MQQKRQNKPLLRHPKGLFSQTIVMMLIASQLMVSTPAKAASMSKLMGLAGFTGMILAIANLNKAMKDAAENPMDKWRRQNVQHALSMMPMAIMGLAAEFKSNKLHDADLPMVQAMLGGFVDVSAPDNYKKFMANPDKRFIPNVGKDFPKVTPTIGSGDSKSLVFNDNVGKNGMQQGAAPAPNGMEGQLVNLDAVSDLPAPVVRSAVSAPSQPKETENLVFDDSAKQIQGLGATADLIAKDVAAGSNTALGQAARDLASVEAQYQAPAAPSAPTKLDIKKKSAGPEDDDFFATPREKRAKKKSKREAYELKTNPKYWTKVFTFSLIPSAHAQGSEESGAKAADILFGLAAIMAAVSPMVAAGIQASADKQIAQTNADAQIQMTEISAATSKQLAAQQRDIALQQAATAQQISGENQAATTERLEIQLAELRQARQESNAVEQQKRQYAQELDAKRFTLAQQQAEASQQLANAQLRAQLTAAGLSQGFSRSQNSATATAAGGLSVARAGGTLATATGGSNAGALSIAARSSGLGVRAMTAEQAANGNLGIAISGSVASNGKARAASRLLSNVGNSAELDPADEVKCYLDKSGNKVCPKVAAKGKAVAGRGVSSRLVNRTTGASVTVSNALTTTIESNRNVRGSSPSEKNSVAATAQTDLQRFTKSASEQERVAFSDYLKEEASVHNRNLGNVRAVNVRIVKEPNAGAYNPPSMEIDTGSKTFGSHRDIMQGAIQ